MWVGGFYYPASRFGESAFLFGSRVGVRANPRTSFEGGTSHTFCLDAELRSLQRRFAGTDLRFFGGDRLVGNGHALSTRPAPMR